MRRTVGRGGGQVGEAGAPSSLTTLEHLKLENSTRGSWFVFSLSHLPLSFAGLDCSFRWNQSIGSNVQGDFSILSPWVSRFTLESKGLENNPFSFTVNVCVCTLIMMTDFTHGKLGFFLQRYFPLVGNLRTFCCFSVVILPFHSAFSLEDVLKIYPFICLQWSFGVPSLQMGNWDQRKNLAQYCASLRCKPYEQVVPESTVQDLFCWSTY